jgi:signal transduction histidine kinase
MKKASILLIIAFSIIQISEAQYLAGRNKSGTITANTDSKDLAGIANSTDQKGFEDLFEPFLIGPPERDLLKTAGSPSGLPSMPEDPDHQVRAHELVMLVTDAAELVHLKGESAFTELSVSGSRWRQGETYIFVLDTQGNMLVHPDPALEGKNQLDLKDVNGKPIIRGLIAVANSYADKPEGWFHYQWPVPGGLLPRWKSSYVHLANAPSGKSYIVGSGIYNDRMEREFVVDIVQDAVAQIGQKGEKAFPLFHDPKGPFIVKDAYVFVIDKNGVEIVNPAFPSLEGRNIMEMKDAQGKYLVKEMFKVLKDDNTGWVDYMWPKPGESVSTQKSTYVSKAKMGEQWMLVGCGVYLSDAPKTVSAKAKMKADELMTLVRDASKVFEKKGEKAYAEFRQKGTRWYRDDTYFFVWTMEGKRVFHAANPEGEGQNMSTVKDVLGRPWGKMFLDAATSTSGEGWVHYMYPEPGDIFPTWKSSFIKRATFPSGKQYLIGCGIYNMDMDKAFIEDVVNHAADVVAVNGKEAFDLLRDKAGPFVFMDIYVFVDNAEGVELVNVAQPSVEGMNILDLKDANGKYVAREYLDVAENKGSGWVDYYWYRPGNNSPAHKYSYVKKVKFGNETYILGAGFYENEETNGSTKVE